MDTLEFAAQRAERLKAADDEMRPFVAAALNFFGSPTAWDNVIEAASVLWLETFERHADADADATFYLAEFQTILRESLANTSAPDAPPSKAQVDRVTMWLGTITVNDATWRAMGTTSMRTMRWVTMHDSAVREMHVVADGQVRRIGGTFDVGGYRLHYPGEPVGPPEVWINCRCLIAPGNVRRSMSMATDTMAVEAPPEEEVVDDLPEDPDAEVEDIEGEDLIDDEVEVPWHAVLAPEGVPTGDGRMFAPGSLSTRDLPLPITYQYETAEGHMKAVVVARMDEAWLDEATGQYRGRGVFWLNEPMAHKAIDGIAQGFLRGLSVDVDDAEVQQPEIPEDATDEEIAAALFEGNETLVFTRARISGASIVHIPAFPEAYIALGPDFEEDVELTEDEVSALAACGCIDGVEYEELAEGGIVAGGQMALVGETGPEYVIPLSATTAGQGFAPGTKDGPGWITHPRATARIRRYWVSGKGAAKIRWGVPGDFNRCRRQLAKYVQRPDWLAGLCANMHKEALGFWPAQHHSSKVPALIASATPAPMFNLVASAESLLSFDAFQNPEMTEPVGIVIDGDRIYGYIATWGTCHIGIPGKCEQAPHSPSNYAYFRTGTVETDGGPVHVGSITMGMGHASMEASARGAMAHYDDTRSVIADVAVGEDGIGIWFSGLLRPNVTDEAKHALAAAGRLSGDWRDPLRNGSLELIAALAVNVPGFPIPQPALVASAGEVRAVTSMGMVEVTEEEALVASALDASTIAAIARTAVEEYIYATEQKAVRAEKMEKVEGYRQALREHTVARLREKISE